MIGFNFLVVAYSLIWAIIFLYVIFLNKKQSELENEIKLLKESTSE